MATINIEAILERVQELKRDSEEKDEVIRAQQVQITELETKAESLEAQNNELETRITELGQAAQQAEELLDRLNQLLG